MSSFTVYTKEGNLQYTGEGYYYLVDSNGTLQIKRSMVPIGSIIQGQVTPQTIAVFNKDYWTVVEYDDV